MPFKKCLFHSCLYNIQARTLTYMQKNSEVFSDLFTRHNKRQLMEN